MLRFAANISLLFTELPMIERLEAAHAAGFEAVEIQFPYPIALDELLWRQDSVGIDIALINLPGGDFGAGDRGLGALPDRIEEFITGIDLCRRYATRLGVKKVNLLAGVPAADTDPMVARRTLIENLRLAGNELGEVGIQVLVEAINTRDVPGFFVSRTQQALDLIDEVGLPNLGLQYDIYHMQVMEGDLIPTMTRHLSRIGNIQFADTPGRHEPGTGEINLPNIFAAIDRLGYTGTVGAEYIPANGTLAGLDWFKPWRKPA